MCNPIKGQVCGVDKVPLDNSEGLLSSGKLREMILELRVIYSYLMFL